MKTIFATKTAVISQGILEQLHHVMALKGGRVLPVLKRGEARVYGT